MKNQFAKKLAEEVHPAQKETSNKTIKKTKKKLIDKRSEEFIENAAEGFFRDIKVPAIDANLFELKKALNEMQINQTLVTRVSALCRDRGEKIDQAIKIIEAAIKEIGD